MKTKAQKKSAIAVKDLILDQKKGTLNAYGERFLLIPVKLIHSIEDRLTESLGPVTANSFEYEIGREGGSKFIQLAQKAGLGIKTAQEIQRVADVLGTMSGWGKGILTGAVAAILKSSCESIEVSCQGKGDKFCEAIIGEPREINRLADTIR